MESKAIGKKCNTNHYIQNADLITTTESGTSKTKGSYIEDVTSTSSSEYPTHGISGSYWYVKK